MRRSSFIAWLAVFGVVAREGVLSGAMTTRSSVAPASYRYAVASVSQGGRCHAARTASRWTGYTRAELG
jgi:hypothetical protein